MEMLRPVVVYIKQSLLHEVQIQALKEGYDLNAVTEVAYEDYLSMGYDDDECREIHGEERFKEIEAVVAKLEAEWEAGKEERTKEDARLYADWKMEMEGSLSHLGKKVKSDRKPVKKRELKAELPKLNA